MIGDLMMKKLSFQLVTILTIIFFVVYLLIAILLTNLPKMSTIFSFSATTTIYILVTLSLFGATKSSKAYGKRVQIAWTFLTVAVFISVIGNILWGVTIFFNNNPFTSLANVLYLTFFPIFLIGILIFPGIKTTPRLRFKRYFDMFIVMFSIVLLLWIFFVEPALQNYNGNMLTLIFTLAYILTGIILIFAMLDLLFNKIRDGVYAPYLVLFGGISVLMVTNCIYAYQTIQGTYISGSPVDLGWLIGYMIIGLAGVSQINDQKINLKCFVTDYLSNNKNFTLTPYLALAGVSLAYISLVWAYYTFNPNLTFLEFGIGILIFLVVTRQIFSINENKNLYRKAQEEISLRKEISKSLKESELAYKTIFENTGTATAIANSENVISLANTEFEKLTGYSKKVVEGSKKWTDFVYPEDLSVIIDDPTMSAKIISNPKNYEFRLIDIDGNIKYIHVIAVPIPGSENNLLSLLDITKTKNAEAAIKKSLKEKEVLLKEIHHRVKNNLTVISSLLNLQSRYIKDKDDLKMFQESQSRAKSMALIHQRLYDSSDLERINFGDYIRSLANDMFQTYLLDPKQIKLEMDVEDVMLDIDTTIPLGLILNELLTNSMKYAFPEDGLYDTTGIIRVKLFKMDENYSLIVEDNGMGLPIDINLETTDSLGLQLIYSLSEQLGGNIELNRTNGTSFKINSMKRNINGIIRGFKIY